MSRIGKSPITVPSGVEMKIQGSSVQVKGPKGQLDRQFHDRVSVSLEDGVATVTRSDDSHESRALHGLSRALLANMVLAFPRGTGVSLSCREWDTGPS